MLVSPGFVPERLATPLAFSLSSTWHFFLAILWRMDAFSRNFPEKEAPQRSNKGAGGRFGSSHSERLLQGSPAGGGVGALTGQQHS